MVSLAKKWRNKKMHSGHQGIEFSLTVSDIEGLLKEAGISSADWCRSGYCLARHGDAGGYVIGNCRFIPRKDNLEERKTSDKMRDAGIRNLTVHTSSRSAEERSRIGRLGGSSGGGLNKLTTEELTAKFKIVEGVDRRSWGWKKLAAGLLGCSSVHVGRLSKRWAEIGLIV